MIFNFITELLLKGDRPTETFIGFFDCYCIFCFNDFHFVYCNGSCNWR